MMSVIHLLRCCVLATSVEKEHGELSANAGGEGQGKCAFLQARDEAMGISSSCHGFPGSFPVIHWLTHSKLLGVISLLWQQENRQNGKWQVWSEWRDSEPRVAMPATWFSWRLLFLTALFAEMIGAAITNLLIVLTFWFLDTWLSCFCPTTTLLKSRLHLFVLIRTVIVVCDVCQGCMAPREVPTTSFWPVEIVHVN